MDHPRWKKDGNPTMVAKYEDEKRAKRCRIFEYEKNKFEVMPWVCGTAIGRLHYLGNSQIILQLSEGA